MLLASARGVEREKKTKPILLTFFFLLFGFPAPQSWCCASANGSAMDVAPATIDAYIYDVSYKNRYIRGTNGVQADVYLWARCYDGNSRCILVRDFEAWFQVEAPPEEEGVDACEELRIALRQILCTYRGMDKISLRVVALEQTPIMGYQEHSKRMLRVYLSSPMGVAPLRNAIAGRPAEDSKAEVVSVPIQIGSYMLEPKAYDANVEFVIRYLIDTGVRCGKWLRVPVPDAADSVPVDGILCSASTIVLSWHDVASAISPDLGPAPLMMLSYDIECSAPGGGFPDPTIADDKVIQISCDLTTTDHHDAALIDASAKRVLFALKETPYLNVGGKFPEYDNVDVRWYDTEDALLLAFAQYVQLEADPDIITGWNVLSFDFSYLVDRAATLGLGLAGVSWSRLKSYEVKNRFEERNSKARGWTRDNKLEMPGRVVLDLLPLFRAGYKLHSYKLDDVAEKFLGERKENVKAKEITKLWFGTKEDRARLGRYCMKDSMLPRRLMFIQLIHVDALEQAAVCCVPVNWLVTRGQGVKVFAQLCAAAYEDDIAVDFIVKDRSKPSKKYKGATVLEPQLGFFEEVVVVLDFESLYPSIIEAFNLCYTTLVQPGPEAERLIAAGDAERAPDIIETDPVTGKPSVRKGSVFVKPHVRKGLLPRICGGLKSKRRAVKEAMALATDPHTKAVLDKRQIALKIACNSCYGYAGATSGRLPSVPVAESVTGYGREMIDTTSAASLEYGPPGIRVLYGDTDSVFLGLGILPDYEAFPGDDLEAQRQAAVKGFAVAYELQPKLNALFRFPNKLAVEKIFLSFLQVRKKRYAGKRFFPDREKGAVYDGISISGLETVRRDNCGLLRNTLETVINTIVEKRDPDAAIAHVTAAVQDLVKGEVPQDQLIISKGFNRPTDQYVSLPEHGVVIERMARRAKEDPDDDIAAEFRPQLGDRIPYVIVAPSKSHPEVPRKKGAKPCVADRAEDPQWAEENGLEPDALYYIERQLLKPCGRIVTALMGDKEEAKRRMLAPIRMTAVPRRGIVRSRLESGTIRALYGSNEISGVRRNAKDERKREGARAEKRKRGQLTAFYTQEPETTEDDASASASAAADAPVPDLEIVPHRHEAPRKKYRATTLDAYFQQPE